jgi:hypothetical protein
MSCINTGQNLSIQHQSRIVRLCVSGMFATALAAPAGLTYSKEVMEAKSQPAVQASSPMAQLPLDFVENRGQWNSSTKFVARRGAVAAGFESDAIKLHLANSPSAFLSFKFEGAATQARLIGENARSGRYNFLIGNDPSKWKSNIAAYGSVRYRGLYKGVDLRILEQSGNLEYELLLAPGASLEQAVIRAEGSQGLELAADGALIVKTSAGPLRQTPPVTWEELPGGGTRPLPSHFRILDSQRFGFEVPGRNPELALVIDPGLEWSTFLGGSNREEIHGLAQTTDGTGDVVVAGSTWSSDFPTAPSGNLGTSPLIAFVARLNSTGTGLVYATLFGGTNGNVAYGLGLALDATGAPIVVGETNAANFPTTAGAYRTSFNEPSASINRGWDAFVTRFNATGNQFVFSTFLGSAPIFDSTRPGSSRGGDESARAVVVDADGSVIVSGYTTSETFPTTAGAYDRTHSTLTVPVNGGTIESRTDVFISRLSPNGAQLTYSTYLGGQSDDLVKDMVIDSQGVLTLVGIEAPLETFDAQNVRTDHGIPFPTTADAVARVHLGASDIFLARLKLEGAGSADLKYATIFGADYVDEATGVALDPNNPGLITLSGQTRSWDFPTTAGAWKRTSHFLTNGVPYYSGLLARFSFPASGAGSLTWSTLVGGATFTGQFADDVAIDPSGDVIVVGSDTSGSFPTTDRSYKRLPIIGEFLARYSGDGRNLLYSTLIHRPSGTLVLRKRLVSSGPNAVLVAGATLFTDFPTTPGAFDRVFGGNGTSDGFHTYDGFVAKFTAVSNAGTDTTATAPTLLAPANGAMIALNSPLTLDWSDVSDGSGVQAYQVDVSMNADFLAGFNFWQQAAGAYPVSQATGSTGQEGAFYWRVRTLDGVNNFSPWSEVRKFTVGAPIWTNFAAVALNPNGVLGGSTVQGRLHIQNAAPPSGIVYTLTSSDPAVASVPSTVVVPAGASSATFTVTTHPVVASKPVKITVWAEGNGDHPVLWVDPASPGAVAVSSLTLAPSSLTGGNPSTATVTLNTPAPTGGALINLSSSNPGVAAVPSGSIVISAGATSTSFAVTTVPVSAVTAVTISAEHGGFARAASLTINPIPAPTAPSLISPVNDATPAQPVTLDWSDVASAASYEVQIDNSSTISSPFVANPTVTTSQLSIGNLPAQSLWWRVRARNSAGTFGPFSSTRRFTPQASSTAPAALSAISVNPTSVVGPASSTGTVTLTAAAPSGGAVVTLTSSNTAIAGVPASITIAAGANSATFNITTAAVTANISVTLTAAYSGVSRTATLTVTAPPPPASLNTLTLNPTSVTGGSSSTGTVSLTSAAPAGGSVVTLSSSSGSATVPASVTIASGATSATFTATTTAVTAATSATISATYAGVSRTAALTINPPGTNVTLSVTATGRSGEQLTSSPTGINVAVGSTASANFTTGTSITLTASNGRDAIWSGACSSGGNKARSCTFTINANASVTGNVQ